MTQHPDPSLDDQAALDETTARQQAAADPRAFAWVSANAGTGKTHVLVNRVARLLLDGAPPDRIVCITYTKAAAAEMENRLFRQLGEWSLLDDAALRKSLFELQGARAEKEDMARARQLFARALETPGGLKIQTIHAFCQAVLQRFPVEAGLSPDFEVIEGDAAKTLQQEARFALFERATSGAEPELAKAHNAIVIELDDTKIAELLELAVFSSDEFDALVKQHPGGELQHRLWRHLALSPDETETGIAAAAMEDSAFDRDEVVTAARLLTEKGTPKAAARGASILDILSRQDRSGQFESYASLFLTAKNEPLANLTVKAASEAEPALRAEQSRILEVINRLRAVRIATKSWAFMTYARAYLEIYRQMKRECGALDFNDLIIAMRELLLPPGDAWVHYKLDEGIDHILVDEAQDTSPEQWRIIELLSREMSAGLSSAEDQGRRRSVFAVGDVKQSIYRFQGAAPEEFEAMRRLIAARCEDVEQPFRSLDLTLSFRSSNAVLNVVDEVFKEARVAPGMNAVPPHRARYAAAPGRVEWWPEETPKDEQKPDPWDVPLDSSSTESPEGRLAKRIARTIRGWLDNGEVLAGTGRAIQPSDIMILVRRRAAFMEHMIRELKINSIPVAGADRLKVTQHIAVMDLLSLARFALCPTDDLTLAEVLKSPFIGFDDDQLFDLAHGRRGSLWAEMVKRRDDVAEIATAHDWLTAVYSRADTEPPFEFFSRVLGPDGGKRKLLARLGPDANDPIDEFLNAAMTHERDHVPSLQGFINHMAQGDGEIKRDMDKGGEEVRVMTVHGAKGLESEIVFLPDTCTLPTSQSDKGLLRGQTKDEDAVVDGEPLFLWSPRKPEDDAITGEAREAYVSETEFEYRRLLYVAMTRARERLYVCGHVGKNGRDDKSWHALVERGMGRLLGTGKDGDKGSDGGDDRSVMTYAVDGPVREDAKTEGRTKAYPGPLPLWAHGAATQERVPLHLSPSALGSEPSAFGPSGPPGKAARRGHHIHKLLEALPDLPAEARAVGAEAYLARFDDEFDESERAELAAETLALFDRPELAPLFSGAAQAEVTISGTVEIDGISERLEGRIDRLAISGDGVWVLDYKTNRPAPTDIEKVPDAYLRQMAAYRRLLGAIYPGITIHSALLWTHAPHLMVLPPDLLDAKWVEFAGKSAVHG